jgi:tetratricopeptide (TPR) repeat protein
MRYLPRLIFTCLISFLLGAQCIAAPVSDNDLGRIYQRGDTLEMQLLAEKGDVRAQHWMGLMLHNRGRYDEAIGWYSRAVENGDAKSANRIAFFFEQGIGRSKDLNKALAWHRKGARLGDFGSQIAYAAALRSGEVLPRDDRKSFHWYAKAAAHPNDHTQRGYAYLPIAEMYERGVGVPRDLGRAYAYAQAAELTVDSSDTRSRENARSIRNNVAARLSPAELAAGERLYRNLASDALDRRDQISRIWARRAWTAGAWLVVLLAIGIMLSIVRNTRSPA